MFMYVLIYMIKAAADTQRAAEVSRTAVHVAHHGHSNR